MAYAAQGSHPTSSSLSSFYQYILHNKNAPGGVASIPHMEGETKCNRVERRHELPHIMAYPSVWTLLVVACNHLKK